MESVAGCVSVLCMMVMLMSKRRNHRKLAAVKAMVESLDEQLCTLRGVTEATKRLAYRRRREIENLMSQNAELKDQNAELMAQVSKLKRAVSKRDRHIQMLEDREARK